MNETEKKKLIAAGRQDIVRAFEINKSGYAGINRQGIIVDRREFPQAAPVPENKALEIPRAKEWPNFAISTEKMAAKVWVARCQVTHPIKAEVNMQGSTEQESIDKLKKFIDDMD